VGVRQARSADDAIWPENIVEEARRSIPALQPAEARMTY